MENHNDANKPCLRCEIKHLLNSKTYLMEAIQFGFKTEVQVEELNAIILELANYIIESELPTAKAVGFSAR